MISLFELLLNVNKVFEDLLVYSSDLVISGCINSHQFNVTVSFKMNISSYVSQI